MRYAGWYPRRRGILEHLDRGTISLLDSAVHDFLCLIADHRTGVARASAAKIVALAPIEIKLRGIQRSLARLEELAWIKRFMNKNQKGNYEILIARFFVRDSAGTWWSTNVERTISPRDVQLDRVTDPSFVSNLVCQEESSVTRNGVPLSHKTAHEPVTQGETVNPENLISCDDATVDAVIRPGHTPRLEAVTPNACDVSPLQEVRREKKEVTVTGDVTLPPGMVCCLKISNPWEFSGLDRNKLRGNGFESNLQRVFEKYREEEHEDGFCTCEPAGFVETLMSDFEERGKKWPPGLLAQKKRLLERGR